MSIEKLEAQLIKARGDLAVKIGTDMVEKKGFKSYSAYTSFMKNASKALKQNISSEEVKTYEDQISASAVKLPDEIIAKSKQFEERLEKWTEDNWGNKLDYREFYPELLNFFEELNRLDERK